MLDYVGAKAYISPLASVAGAELNSGWFHYPPPPVHWKLTLEFGSMGSNVSARAKETKFERSGYYRLRANDIVDMLPNYLSQPERQALSTALTNRNYNVHLAGPTLFGSDFGWDIFGENNDDEPIRIIFPAQQVHYSFNGEDKTADIAETTIQIPVAALADWLFNESAFSQGMNYVTVGTYKGTQATVCLGCQYN
jgi:hypothetical protein